MRVTESKRGTRFTLRIPSTGITMTRKVKTGGSSRKRRKQSSDNLFG